MNLRNKKNPQPADATRRLPADPAAAAAAEVHARQHRGPGGSELDAWLPPRYRHRAARLGPVSLPQDRIALRLSRRSRGPGPPGPGPVNHAVTSQFDTVTVTGHCL